ncbi:ammonium transporter [bacterium]|nr:ammonium transporter [bacterium]
MQNPFIPPQQLLSVIIIGIYSFILTWCLLKALSYFLPLRAKENEEEIGLDISSLGEQIY